MAGVVMAMAAMVVMTKGERGVECEEEEVNKMQDNFIKLVEQGQPQGRRPLGRTALEGQRWEDNAGRTTLVGQRW